MQYFFSYFKLLKIHCS